MTMSMEQILKVLILTPTEDGMGAPAMFWGPPGVGKTKIIRAVCKKLGLPIKVLSPGLQGEGAFGVTPVPVGEGAEMRIHYPRPGWTEEFEDIGCGVVFVDEITTAPPAMQPPLLGLIQERRVGDHYLGERVRVYGAGNPPAQAAGGWDLAPPVANRMGHFDWAGPSQADWSDYMLAKGGQAGGKATGGSTADLEAMEKRITDHWAGAYAKQVGLVSAFTAKRTELLYKMPKEGDAQGSRAWPSHRSWDLATNVLTTAAMLQVPEEVTQALLAGFVGEGAATEFVAYSIDNDLPDPEALLDGKVQWRHDPARLDRSMAVFSACAALVAPEKADKRDPRASALWLLLAGAINEVDVCVPAARTLAKAKLGTVKGSTPMLTKLRPVLDAAGINPNDP